MRRRVLSALAAFSLVLATAAASYAQLRHSAEARIPFEFAVSGKVLPDGAYIVTRDTSGFLKIESLDSSNAVLALAIYTRSNAIPTEAKLVFDRIGDHYFLSQIWEPGNSTGTEIPRSTMERNLINRTLTNASPNSEHKAGPELVYLTGRVL